MVEAMKNVASMDDIFLKMYKLFFNIHYKYF